MRTIQLTYVFRALFAFVLFTGALTNTFASESVSASHIGQPGPSLQQEPRLEKAAPYNTGKNILYARESYGKNVCRPVDGVPFNKNVKETFTGFFPGW